MKYQKLKDLVIYLFSISPYPELIIRKYLKTIYSRRKQNKIIKRNEIINIDIELKNEFDKTLRNYLAGSKLVILHTSMANLSNIYKSPLELLKTIREIIGEDGTIVVPTFNKLDENNEILVDFKTSSKITTTGLLSSIFLRLPNVKRSEFPLNNLSAQGPHASKIFEENTDTDLAHGINSSWYYCYENDARILFLGVSSRNTTTMVHVAEDTLDSKWPVSDWYEWKNVLIDGKLFRIRKRKDKWSRYNASFYRSLVLKKQKLLIEKNLELVKIGVISSSKKMVDFLIKSALEKKIFFKVPKKNLR